MNITFIVQMCVELAVTVFTKIGFCLSWLCDCDLKKKGLAQNILYMNTIAEVTR